MEGGPDVIRRGRPSDVAPILHLVEAVLAETYAHLFGEEGPSGPDASDPWTTAWVAETAGKVIGVGLATGDRVGDLWISQAHRGRGLGAALLGRLEAQIAEHSHLTARLRVVAENVSARSFYRRQGWIEDVTYDHERWGFPMMSLSEALNRKSGAASGTPPWYLPLV